MNCKWQYLVFVLIFSTSCASWKKETLSYMGAGFAAGAVVGASQAPKGDDKAMHAALWGGVTSALVGATLVYLKDDDRRLHRKQNEIRALEEKLAKFEEHKKPVVDNGQSYLSEASLPEQLRHLVEPAEWSLYAIDEWKKIGESEYIHQDKLLEFKPPKVKIKK